MTYTIVTIPYHKAYKRINKEIHGALVKFDKKRNIVKKLKRNYAKKNSRQKFIAETLKEQA